MNEIELKCKLLRANLTQERFAKAMGISKSAMQNKLDGKTQFKQSEILKAIDVLALTDEEVFKIFFDKGVV